MRLRHARRQLYTPSNSARLGSISRRNLMSFTRLRARPLPSLEVQLTERENELCTLLDDCSKWICEKYPGTPSVECRIAGGWVRDKLLGLQSHDIDIALSTMMGTTFAEHLVEYMKSKGEILEEAKTIARNPQQSKHLETAMVRIRGLELDLVNLRNEVYAENTRIPTEVAFGTPLEDASRRDITINALFYNIHNRSVEDFTGKGLDDLKEGIVRTPLKPKETFLDDPLRVLRCVRFASRYGYTIDESTSLAIRQPEIQEAVKHKISRERVGAEINKMMTAAYPLDSLRMLDSLGLYDAICWLPDSTRQALRGTPKPRSIGLRAAIILDSLLSQAKSDLSATTSMGIELPPIHPSLLTHALEAGVRPRMYLASYLTPWKELTMPEKKRNVSAVEVLMRDGLKLGNLNFYMDGIPALFEAAQQLSRPSLSKFVVPGDMDTQGHKSTSTARSRIGLLLREKTVHNPHINSHWTSSVLFSLVQDLEGVWTDSAKSLDKDKAREIIEEYNQFVKRVEYLNLESAVDTKALLDGREICASLSLKPSPLIGPIVNQVVEWQLSYPEEDKDACIAWLKEEQLVGRLPPAEDTTAKRASKDEGRPKKKAKLIDEQPNLIEE